MSLLFKIDIDNELFLYYSLLILLFILISIFLQRKTQTKVKHSGYEHNKTLKPRISVPKKKKQISYDKSFNTEY